MSPLKRTNISPTDIEVCVVDAMKVLRLIPITTIQPPTFIKWAEAVKIYLENLPGNHYMFYLIIIHLAIKTY